MRGEWADEYGVDGYYAQGRREAQEWLRQPNVSPAAYILLLRAVASGTSHRPKRAWALGKARALREETSTMSDRRLAENLQRAELSGDTDAIIAAENAICARLDIPLNETEQGLTPKANAMISDFCDAQGVFTSTSVRP